MEVKVLFSKKNYTVTLLTPTNGSIEVGYYPEGGTSENLQTVTSGMKLPAGTNISVRATPKEGYEFTKFDMDGTEKIENPLEFVLTEDTKIGGDFVPTV